jgi:hypothetical protein
MSIKLAFKAFLKAWRFPKEAENFLADKPSPKALAPSSAPSADHLRFLSHLQQSSRLLDFFKEDISEFDDEQVGAAVRAIHRDCGKALEELIALRPLLDKEEGETIAITEGYDPQVYKLIGNLKGTPPYKGVIKHRGWKAHRLSLPKSLSEQKKEVVCPAEVEIL